MVAREVLVPLRGRGKDVAGAPAQSGHLRDRNQINGAGHRSERREINDLPRTDAKNSHVL
jgi:hypothetical protein